MAVAVEIVAKAAPRIAMFFMVAGNRSIEYGFEIDGKYFRENCGNDVPCKYIERLYACKRLDSEQRNKGYPLVKFDGILLAACRHKDIPAKWIVQMFVQH